MGSLDGKRGVQKGFLFCVKDKASKVIYVVSSRVNHHPSYLSPFGITRSTSNEQS